jgi:hypothetical protein
MQQQQDNQQQQQLHLYCHNGGAPGAPVHCVHASSSDAEHCSSGRCCSRNKQQLAPLSSVTKVLRGHARVTEHTLAWDARLDQLLQRIGIGVAFVSHCFRLSSVLRRLSSLGPLQSADLVLKCPLPLRGASQFTCARERGVMPRMGAGLDGRQADVRVKCATWGTRILSLSSR